MEYKNCGENIPALYFPCQFQHTDSQKSIFLVEFCFMIFVPSSYFCYSTLSWAVLNIFLTVHRHYTAGFFYIFCNTFSCFHLNFRIYFSVLICFSSDFSVSLLYLFLHFLMLFLFLILFDHWFFWYLYPPFSSHKRISVATCEGIIFIFHGHAFIFFSSCCCFYSFCEVEFI